MRDPFARSLKIKAHPELRHALAHYHLALEALAEGRLATCFDELHSIESVIFYPDDPVRTEVEERSHGAQEEEEEAEEPLQGPLGPQVVEKQPGPWWARPFLSRWNRRRANE